MEERSIMGKKVLFVDDTKYMRKIASMALTGAGYEALLAGDGNEGLAVLAEEYREIKLVMTDWNMPGMDGYDFLVNIKKNPLYKHIPVVMLTSESEKSFINKALEAGAGDYIIKPFSSPDEMLDKVNKLII
ncbi:MAG TPA: hypothetical protein DD435_07870 [Cyanobacteria bacterium UBA8530]|nr:hypothetical protein [Cyanobacteria bacterium UBA8530]